MTTQQIYKGLRWLRDYGIIALTIVIIALTVSYFRHDYLISKKVIPEIMSGVAKQADNMDQNNTKLVENTLQIDSLQREINHLDSVLNIPYYKRFPESYLLMRRNADVIDSLQKQINYLIKLLEIPSYKRFPDEQRLIDSLQQQILYLDSIVQVPFENRNFDNLPKK